MGETELSGAGPNGLADDEVDSPVDLDLPSIRREIRFRAPTGSDDDQPIDEQMRGVGHRKRGALRGFLE